MIRKFKPTDQDQTLTVWYNASVVAHDFLGEDFFTKERKAIVENYFPVTEKWVYEFNGCVVGFIAMIENEVGAIFVDPDVQGQGIGRVLMDHVRQSRDFLELDVFKNNHIGRRFYDHYGFRFVHESIHEETGQPQLRLRLGA